jgi:hypothetical protein
MEFARCGAHGLIVNPPPLGERDQVRNGTQKLSPVKGALARSYINSAALRAKPAASRPVATALSELAFPALARAAMPSLCTRQSAACHSFATTLLAASLPRRQSPRLQGAST